MAERVVTPELSRQSRLAMAVDEFMDEFRNGQRPAVNDFANRYPELAEELRRVLPALAMLGSSANGANAIPIETELGTLGDFRIIREIGRGGMGIVYEAEQISLNRRVALKILPMAATLDPKSLQRFRHEAQAAAMLHHSNIVPVHGVGCERGVHYYAMQLIDGITLAHVIDEVRQTRNHDECRMSNDESRQHQEAQSQRIAETKIQHRNAASTIFSSFEIGQSSFKYYRRIAQWVAQAANALEYAHGMGVIHRDIKPANLLIDSSHQLWITDFGLAKLGAEAGVTMTGDLVGTLRYMSPEQALSDHGMVDHRTDIYALGATLYELVTGRPAVPGADKQEVLRRIAFEEPIRPQSIEPNIPWELETIILKSLEKRPEARYQSAKQLANDLQLWLDNKPIAAKRPGLRDRLVKWMRRHPGVTATTTISAITLVALTIAGLAWNNRLIRKEQAQTKLALEDAAKGRQRARDALDQMSSRIIDDWLSRQEKLTAQQKQFLEMALAQYEDFTREVGDSVEQRWAMARAYWRVGDIRRRLGQWADADSALERSVKLHQALVAERPNQFTFESSLARVYHSRAIVQVKLSQSHQALSSYGEAIALHEKLTRDHPEQPQFKFDLAGALNDLAILQQRSLNWDAAQASYDRAIGEFSTLNKAHTSVAKYSAGLVKAIQNRAGLKISQGRLNEALGALTQARNLAERLTTTHPSLPEFAVLFAGIEASLGQLHRRSGRIEESVTTLMAARERAAALARDYPSTAEYRELLAQIHLDLGTSESLLGRHTDARKSFDNVQLLATELMRESQESPDHISLLARFHHGLAILQARMGARDDALKSFDEAKALRDELVKRHPDVPAYLAELADSLTSLAGIRMELGQRKQALSHYRSAMEWREMLASQHPGMPEVAVNLGGAYCNLGTYYRNGGDLDSARSWYDKAINVIQSVIGSHAHSQLSRLFLRNSYFGRAATLMALDRHANAITDWDQAIELDEGKDRRWFRIQRALCQVHVDPEAASDEAAKLISENPIPSNVAYDAARVFAATAERLVDANLRERRLTRAMELLKGLHNQGYFRQPARLANLKTNRELEILRQREDFIQMMKELNQD